MVNIQLQTQDLVKLANIVNIVLANIKLTLLQDCNTHSEQIGGNIYSISGKLRSIIYRNMKWQAHYIQVLLADKLNQYKGKENKWIEECIKIIQKSVLGIILKHFLTNGYW